MSAYDASSNPNKYVIDIESGAETARLIEQDKLITQAMGGLFPEQQDLASVKRILDIGCGPGSWVLEVAFAYAPRIEVVGIDLNQTMVEYARALAWSRGLNNATFGVGDVKQPLDFAENSFNLVNARFIFSFMDKESWPALLAECRRILRPGGIVRLTEYEKMISSSLSWQRIEEYLYQALARQGRTFSVTGHTVGLAHAFGKLLKDAGFEQIQRRPFVIDGSYGAELHYAGSKDAEIGFALLKPYLVRSGVVEEAEFDEIYRQMLIDMREEEYLSLGFGLTTWAVKPSE